MRILTRTESRTMKFMLLQVSGKAETAQTELITRNKNIERQKQTKTLGKLLKFHY